MKGPSEPGTSPPEARGPQPRDPQTRLGRSVRPVGVKPLARCLAESRAWEYSLREGARTSWPRLGARLLALSLCTLLTGCFGFLKPARSSARRFVLTPLPTAELGTVHVGALAVGVGQVKLPAYLFDSSLAVRRGTNELEYLPSALWAERLDTGLQRVLAANLATLLPTDQIRLSAWRTEDVAAEVYVAVEQFDVDTRGRGLLVARWRILAPGGEKTLKAGESRLARQGPPPETNPSGAVATLSDLAAELSRQVAQAITETVSAVRPAPVAQ